MSYLSHHGIEGQKWGVQNGPPYPLNPSRDYTAAERKANRIVSKLDKWNNSKYKRNVDNAYDSAKKIYKKIRN